MKRKHTYEELEKRNKELERERQFGHDRLIGIIGGSLQISTAEPSSA